MSLNAFLRRVIEILDATDVPYMMTGSLVSAFYAVPRATQDLDVVIATGEAGVNQLVQRLQDVGWYVDGEAALEAQRTQGQFNAEEARSKVLEEKGKRRGLTRPVCRDFP